VAVLDNSDVHFASWSHEIRSIPDNCRTPRSREIGRGYAWPAGTLRAIVADHKQNRINDLMPWNYPAEV